MLTVEIVVRRVVAEGHIPLQAETVEQAMATARRMAENHSLPMNPPEEEIQVEVVCSTKKGGD